MKTIPQFAFAAAIALAATVSNMLGQGASTPVSPSNPAVLQLGADGSDFSYYYFKQRVALTADAAAIAVQDDAQFAGAARTDAETSVMAKTSLAGLAPTAVRRHAGGAWTIVETNATPRGADRAAVETRLNAALVKTPARFVSPVFRGSDGSPLLVSHRIAVGFTRETSEAEALAILARLPGAVHWTKVGRKLRYSVEMSHRNALDVLAAANALAVKDQVLYAGPSFLVRLRLPTRRPIPITGNPGTSTTPAKMAGCRASIWV